MPVAGVLVAPARIGSRPENALIVEYCPALRAARICVPSPYGESVFFLLHVPRVIDGRTGKRGGSETDRPRVRNLLFRTRSLRTGGKHQRRRNQQQHAPDRVISLIHTLCPFFLICFLIVTGKGTFNPARPG